MIFRHTILFKLIPYPSILLLFCNVVFYYYIIMYKHSISRKDLILLLLIALFCISMLLSAWIGEILNIKLIIFEIFNMGLALIVFLIIIPRIFSKEKFNDIFIFLIYTSLFISLAGVIFRFVNIKSLFSISLPQDKRISPIIPGICFLFKHPNQFGTLLMSFPALSFYIFYIKKQKRYLLYSFIFIVSVILSFSRSSYLMIFISVLPFVYLFFKYIYVNYLKRLSFLILILVLIIAIAFSVIQIKPDVIYIFIRSKNVFSTRETIWTITIREISQKYLYFGKGYNNYKIKHYSPHNAYLAVFAYNGIIGLLLFLSLLIYTLVISLTKGTFQNKGAYLILFLLAGLLIQQNFETQVGIAFNYINYLFFFIFGYFRFLNVNLRNKSD